MERIHIRAGTIEDVEAIMQVHRRSILGLGCASYTEEECASWSAGLELRQYHNAMVSGGEIYLVAESGKNLVGFCSYKDREIVGLYVEPTTSRSGIGTQLLQAVAGWRLMCAK